MSMKKFLPVGLIVDFILQESWRSIKMVNFDSLNELFFNYTCFA